MRRLILKAAALLLLGGPGVLQAEILPQLPQSFLETTYAEPTGTVRPVNAGGDLQDAINAAAPGEVIVLQAGAIGGPGEVLVLDMGDPVRIADVARRLAEMAGPDIEVEFDPKAVRQGKDPQLEKAIEIVMEELKKYPVKHPARPPFDRRTDA